MEMAESGDPASQTSRVPTGFQPVPGLARFTLLFGGWRLVPTRSAFQRPTVFKAVPDPIRFAIPLLAVPARLERAADRIGGDCSFP